MITIRLIKRHLNQFKAQLTPKPKEWSGAEWKGRKPGAYQWYEIEDAVDYFKEFEKEKIILPDIALRMQASIEKNHAYCANTAYIIPLADRLLLAILNSKLVEYYYQHISSSIRGGYLRFIRQYLELIPIVYSNNNLKEKVEKYVDLLFTLNKEKQQTTLPEKLEQLQQRINYTDEKINKLVYQLYGLNEEEIKIVENI